MKWSQSDPLTVMLLLAFALNFIGFILAPTILGGITASLLGVAFGLSAGGANRGGRE